MVSVLAAVLLSWAATGCDAVLDDDYFGVAGGRRVGVVGDSVTAQAAPDLHDALDPWFRVRIRAVYRQTFATMQPQAELLAEDPPDAVVLALGSNDLIDDDGSHAWQDDLEVMLATFPQSCIVLVTVTEASPLPGFAEAAAEMNASFRAVPNVHVADWAAELTPADYDEDPTGLHPDVDSRPRFAAVVRRAVSSCWQRDTW